MRDSGAGSVTPWQDSMKRPAAKVDAVEACELTLQTVSNMTRTFSRKKRQRMADVLVNGIARPSEAGDELRLFVRIISDLDEVHVEMLHRAATAPSGHVEIPEDRDARKAILAELVGRGLLGYTPDDTFTGRPERYEITAFACRFLAHLRPPTTSG